MELLNVAATGGVIAPRIARRIIQHGCDPNERVLRDVRDQKTGVVQSHVQLTPLHVACHAGHVNLVIELLRSRADPNVRTSAGDTALHCAVRSPTKCGRRLVCAALLAHGADETAVDSSHDTPVKAAEARHGRRSKIACFLRNPPPLGHLHAELEVEAPLPRVRNAVRSGFCAEQIAKASRRWGSPSRKRQVDAECAICLLPLDEHEDVMQIPCDGQHEFHKECLLPWLRKNASCPQCRAGLRRAL